MPILPMPRGLPLLAALLLSAAAPLDAQRSGARTTYVVPNALFYFQPDQPLYCERIQMDPEHRKMGISLMFQYSLPLSGRSGQLGLTADSTVRYLLVWRDEYISTYQQRRLATIHFRRNGSLEVGRQSWQEIRADSMPQSTVSGLHAVEGEHALALARHLASRCH